MYYSVFNRSPVEWYTGWFQFEAILDEITVNIHAYIFV